MFQVHVKVFLKNITKGQSQIYNVVTITITPQRWLFASLGPTHILRLHHHDQQQHLHPPVISVKLLCLLECDPVYSGKGY